MGRGCADGEECGCCDMGKACARFCKEEDLPLHVVGTIVGSTSPDRFIALYEGVRKQSLWNWK